MSATPEVSVVLGVRDGGAGLRRSVESVLAQRGVELELIVVDDGSQDGAVEPLVERARTEARLRLLRQERLGLTVALVAGCAAARAPFIARHDAGDRSHPERLRRQLDRLAAEPQAVLCSPRTLCLGPAFEPLYVEVSKGEANGAVAILEGEPPTVVAGPSSHGAALFRADACAAVGGYRTEFALGQDWDLWQRLGLVGSFVTVHETLYARTLELDSSSFALRELQRELGRLSLDAVRRRARGANEDPVLERARELSRRVAGERAARHRAGRAAGAYHVGELLRRRGDRRARGYLAAAIRERPLSARAWVRWAQTFAPSPAAAAPLPQVEVAWALEGAT